MSAGDLQLDWLRAFVSTVDEGSLTAAAPRLHRSQSAMSMQLRKLEEAAGRTLLSRGPRHLELTAAGRELMPHAPGLETWRRDPLPVAVYQPGSQARKAVALLRSPGSRGDAAVDAMYADLVRVLQVVS